MSFQCLLIGGASHVGKSTLAAAWGGQLGWPVLSTDGLGRHPGRPWPMGGRPVPPHVIEHYTGMTEEELLESNLAHYRTMWPLLETVVAAHLAAPLGRLMLEGSGCLPDHMLAAQLSGATALWLVASDDLIAHRIRQESGYAAAEDGARRLIDRFIARTRLFNRHLADRLDALGLAVAEVRDGESPEETIARCQDCLVTL